MFLSATTLQLLMEKGINGADLVEVYAALEADWRSVEPLNSETAADRKKARDAARMAQKRAEERQSRDVASDYDDSPASPSFLPPRPPNQTTPTPPDITTRARNGARLPEGWEPSERDRLDAAEILGSPEAVSAELDKFRDYWRAVPGAKGRKLDWPATWRNWSRTAAERKPRNGLRTPNVPGPDHKLAAKDANFARAFAGADAAADFLAERRRSGF